MTLAKWGCFEMSEPDIYSDAWHRKQIRGISYGLNRCLAEHDEFSAGIKLLNEHVEKLVAGLRGAREEIGLQADEIAELKESMEKAREAFRELKDQKGKS